MLARFLKSAVVVSMQDGSGCPIGAAHRGYSACFPGTLRLWFRYTPSAPAHHLPVGRCSTPLRGKAAMLLPQ